MLKILMEMVALEHPPRCNVFHQHRYLKALSQVIHDVEEGGRSHTAVMDDEAIAAY